MVSNCRVKGRSGEQDSTNESRNGKRLRGRVRERETKKDRQAV